MVAFNKFYRRNSRPKYFSAGGVIRITPITGNAPRPAAKSLIVSDPKGEADWRCSAGVFGPAANHRDKWTAVHK
jgi:hypothetical protein